VCQRSRTRYIVHDLSGGTLLGSARVAHFVRQVLSNIQTDMHGQVLSSTAVHPTNPDPNPDIKEDPAEDSAVEGEFAWNFKPNLG
jgi:hypothetical protein